MPPSPFPNGRAPTTAELQQLRIRANAGDQLAKHALGVLEQISAGGVPVGGGAAPPGYKMMDMGTVKMHLLPCGACGSKLFEKTQFAEAFYDENDPSHQWYGKPVPVTLCAKCGSEQVITTIHRQGSDPKEPEVRYEYSTRIFKYGMQQIQQILAEQRIQIVNEVAEVIDQHFGKGREAEATELMTKIATMFGLKDGTAAPATPATPPPEPEPVPAPQSKIITEV